MAYDSKCYDLAESFLEDSPHLNTEGRRHILAQLIQTTIEDEIAHMERNSSKQQSRTRLLTWNATTTSRRTGEVWEYWQSLAMAAETHLHLIAGLEPASPATEFDSNLLSANDANKLLGEVFRLARVGLSRPPAIMDDNRDGAK